MKEANVEQKLVDMLDALQNGAVKVGEQVVKYSPDVADAALWVVRIDAAEQLFATAMLLISGLFFIYKVKPLWVFAEKNDDSEGLLFIAPLGAALYSFGALVASTIRLTDLWPWVAIFEPKLYIAKQIIDSALGN